MNDELLSFIGSIIMWVSLSQLYSGYNLSVYNERYEVELSRLNCLIAGACSALGAMVLKKVFDWKYYNKTRSSQAAKSKTSFDISVQFANPLSNVDLFIMGRAMIAGCVIVSAPGTHYKIWISALLGVFCGFSYIATCYILQKFKIDDPFHVFHTHGVPALLSLILIVVFQD